MCHTDINMKHSAKKSVSLVAKSVFFGTINEALAASLKEWQNSPGMGWQNSPGYFEVLKQAQYLNF